MAAAAAAPPVAARNVAGVPAIDQLAGARNPPGAPSVEQIEGILRDTLVTARNVRVHRDGSLPWEVDTKGLLYGTYSEQLLFRINLMCDWMGIERVEGNFLKKQLGKRNDKFYLLKNTYRQRIDNDSLRSQIAPSLINLLAEYSLIKEEELFRARMCNWALGRDDFANYKKCHWLPNEVSRAKTDPRAGQKGTDLMEFWQKMSLTQHEPGLAKGMIGDRDITNTRIKFFLDYLGSTVPKTDEMIYLWYKYIILERPVDTDYIFSLEWLHNEPYGPHKEWDVPPEPAFELHPDLRVRYQPPPGTPGGSHANPHYTPEGEQEQLADPNSNGTGAPPSAQQLQHSTNHATRPQPMELDELRERIRPPGPDPDALLPRRGAQERQQANDEVVALGRQLKEKQAELQRVLEESQKQRADLQRGLAEAEARMHKKGTSPEVKRKHAAAFAAMQAQLEQLRNAQPAMESKMRDEIERLKQKNARATDRAAMEMAKYGEKLEKIKLRNRELRVQHEQDEEQSARMHADNTRRKEKNAGRKEELARLQAAFNERNQQLEATMSGQRYQLGEALQGHERQMQSALAEQQGQFNAQLKNVQEQLLGARQTIEEMHTKMSQQQPQQQQLLLEASQQLATQQQQIQQLHAQQQQLQQQAVQQVEQVNQAAQQQQLLLQAAHHQVAQQQQQVQQAAQQVQAQMAQNAADAQQLLAWQQQQQLEPQLTLPAPPAAAAAAPAPAAVPAPVRATRTELPSPAAVASPAGTQPSTPATPVTASGLEAALGINQDFEPTAAAEGLPTEDEVMAAADYPSEVPKISKKTAASGKKTVRLEGGRVVTTAGALAAAKLESFGTLMKRGMTSAITTPQLTDPRNAPAMGGYTTEAHNREAQKQYLTGELATAMAAAAANGNVRPLRHKLKQIITLRQVQPQALKTYINQAVAGAKRDSPVDIHFLLESLGVKAQSMRDHLEKRYPPGSSTYQKSKPGDMPKAPKSTPRADTLAQQRAAGARTAPPPYNPPFSPMQAPPAGDSNSPAVSGMQTGASQRRAGTDKPLQPRKKSTSSMGPQIGTGGTPPNYATMSTHDVLQPEAGKAFARWQRQSRTTESIGEWATRVLNGTSGDRASIEEFANYKEMRQVLRQIAKKAQR